MNPQDDSPAYPSLYLSPVAAGFATAVEDYLEGALDLNALVVKHPAATFYVKAAGDSMRDAGIQSGDILAVDRSLEAAHGKIVIAILNGEFTVKKLRLEGKQVYLDPANPDYSPIKVPPRSDFQVWGVVTYVIRQMK